MERQTDAHEMLAERPPCAENMRPLQQQQQQLQILFSYCSQPNFTFADKKNSTNVKKYWYFKTTLNTLYSAYKTTENRLRFVNLLSLQFKLTYLPMVFFLQLICKCQLKNT